jgi:hypothetical protein
VTFVEEELQQAHSAGNARLNRSLPDDFIARYEALLGDGLAQNPLPPPLEPLRRGQRKQSPVGNLLGRLWTYEHEA